MTRVESGRVGWGWSNGPGCGDDVEMPGRPARRTPPLLSGLTVTALSLATLAGGAAPAIAVPAIAVPAIAAPASVVPSRADATPPVPVTTASDATTVTSVPTVGALFFPSVLGVAVLLGLPHECSGSVVHSPGHNLVMTAAHCIAGTGFGFEFAPGYHDGVAPYGVWSVRRVYVDDAWLKHQDPQHDYAFLEMARAPWHGVTRAIEDVTGAYLLGSAPAPGATVTVDGYLAGSGGSPITCTATVYYTAGFPSFGCSGFAAGTSGGPWSSGNQIVGVIGGLHQGGCTDGTSYSSAFGTDTSADWERAVSGGPANSLPLAGPDGCAAG
jgi:hypothetical protein